ncbi:MAG: hypothetical protein HWQ23_16475 [Nostoc sp. JL33]|nr:hypothetical protein [Nostoc sp. JL33]
MNRYIISLPASRDLQAIAQALTCQFADYFAVENVPHGNEESLIKLGF